MRERNLAAALSLSLSACATMPNVTSYYYLPKAETTLVVTETLGCDKGEKRLLSASSVVATTTYEADVSKPQHILFSDYGGHFIDADLAMNMTADGRLSGVNSTTSGEAASILKSGIALTGAIGGLFAFDGSKPAVDVVGACKEVATLAGAKSADGTGKLLTVTYSATFSYSDDGKAIMFDPDANPSTYPSGPQTSVTLQPDPDTPPLKPALAFLNSAFRLSFGSPIVDKTEKTPAIDRSIALASWAGNSRGFKELMLNKVGAAALTVSGPGPNMEPASRTVWRGTASIPLTDQGHQYKLPIPSGTYLGKQGFALALSDDGAITKLEYSTNTGVGDALDAGTSLVDLVPTTAAKATAKKDQADLIYQQQRLIACKLNASTCPSQ